MTKTILADVSGFTPVIDRMAMEHGLVYAAVFGRMWRFCQMEDGVCKASLDKIANGLHIDKATVMRYADRLVEDGYLKDLTPDRRNAPHIYADTGKASIRVGIGATVAGCNAEVDDNETVAQCNATVADSNATVAHDQLKIVSKKHSKDIKDGISHPDFEAACAIVKTVYPADFEQASPVLLEADERPNRMLIKLSAVPAGFMDAFKTALEQVTRRRYAVSFETPGTGRVVVPEIDADPPDAVEPVSAEHLELWHTILGELRVDIQPATYQAYIAQAHPISVNGDWTIAVPSVTWWRMHMPSALKRIYKGLTGKETTFVFQEDK